MARKRTSQPLEPTPRSPRSRGTATYSDAFKAEAVAAARVAQSIAQVAQQLGVARNTLSAWMRDAPPPPMSLVDAAKSGNRKAYLEALRDELAEKIAAGMSARDLPPNVRLLNETMQQIEELTAREAEESADAASAPDEDLDPDDI